MTSLKPLAAGDVEIGFPVREELLYLAPGADALTVAVSGEAAQLIEQKGLPIEETVRAAKYAVLRARASMPRDEFRNRDYITGTPPSQNSLVLPQAGFNLSDTGTSDNPYGESFMSGIEDLSPLQRWGFATAAAFIIWRIVARERRDRRKKK